jgi:hypothetical protein
MAAIREAGRGVPFTVNHPFTVDDGRPTIAERQMIGPELWEKIEKAGHY